MRCLRLGFAVPLCVAMMVLATSGCGKKLPTYPVKGTITWKRKPPPQQINLTFWREPGKDTDVQAGGAITDESGEFSTECEKGKYKVTLSLADTTAQPTELKGLEEGSLEQAIVLIYKDRTKTPLTVEVTEKGENKFDFIIRRVGEPPPPDGK